MAAAEKLGFYDRAGGVENGPGPLPRLAYVAGMNEKLSELLAKTRPASCVFGGGLSNHMPMVLIALERLGP